MTGFFPKFLCYRVQWTQIQEWSHRRFQVRACRSRTKKQQKPSVDLCDAYHCGLLKQLFKAIQINPLRSGMQDGSCWWKTKVAQKDCVPTPVKGTGCCPVLDPIIQGPIMRSNWQHTQPVQGCFASSQLPLGFYPAIGSTHTNFIVESSLLFLWLFFDLNLSGIIFSIRSPTCLERSFPDGFLSMNCSIKGLS